MDVLSRCSVLCHVVHLVQAQHQMQLLNAMSAATATAPVGVVSGTLKESSVARQSMPVAKLVHGAGVEDFEVPPKCFKHPMAAGARLQHGARAGHETLECRNGKIHGGHEPAHALGRLKQRDTLVRIRVLTYI